MFLPLNGHGGGRVIEVELLELGGGAGFRSGANDLDMLVDRRPSEYQNPARQ
jgi:hypothetical protein